MGHSCDYRFYPQVIVRTPFYPYASYRKSLNDIVQDPYFIAAIYVSSKSLFNVLKKNNFEVDWLSNRELYSVKMYFNRMCHRPTPFGLFSGITVSLWSNENDCYLDHKPQLHCLPDYHCSVLITKLILNQMADFEHTYALNKTLYKVNNRFRYLRTLQDKSGKEDIIVDSIGLTEEMINILSYFNEKRTKLDIINFLIQEYDVSLEEGTAFAEELINEQVICPELQPNITGKDFMDRGKNITSNVNT